MIQISNCPSSLRPPVSRLCNLGPCPKPAKWTAGKWNQVSGLVNCKTITITATAAATAIAVAVAVAITLTITITTKITIYVLEAKFKVSVLYKMNIQHYKNSY